MENIHTKYKIEVLSKALITEKSYDKVKIHKIIKIDQETIEFLKENGYKLCFEMHVPSFDGRARKNSPKNIYSSSNIPRIDNPKFNSYNATFIDAKTCKNISNDSNQYFYEGTDGVFRVTIPSDEIKTFIKEGTIETQSSVEPIDISIKLLKAKDDDGKKLASFKLADSLQLNTKKSGNYKANEYSLFSFSPFLNCINIYGLRPIVDNKYSSIKRKPYFLARLAFANHYNKEFDTKNNVPYSYYEGILAYINIKNNRAKSWHKADASIVLSSPQKIKWVDITGEQFIPINYGPSYINDYLEKGLTFEEKQYPNQILMRPYDKNLVLITLIHNPVTNKWERKIIPFIDQSKTIIYFDEKNKAWKSKNTDIWGAISHNSFDSFPGINNNFSVEYSYTEKYTFAIARGLNLKTISAQIEDRCIPLINFIPKAKQKRAQWSKADKIIIQQSTSGLKSNKKAFLVKIDPLTNKVIHIYNMNKLVGTKIRVSAQEFRNGLIALALGPNRCRLDISPAAPSRYGQAVVTETHGVLAGGYRTNNKNYNLSFNY